MHHYRSIAERSLKENLADGQIRIKKIFYVLRPLFACRWIEHRQSQPPTEFGRLVEQEWVSAEEKEWVAELLKQKASAVEAKPIALDERIAAKLMQELEQYKTAAEERPSPVKSGAGDLDELLRAWVTAG